jgi:excisionase family DNA binding protein
MTKKRDTTELDALFAPDLMTVAEAARYLRFTPSTIRRFARQGTLPSVKVGAEYRFSMAALTAKLNEGANISADHADDHAHGAQESGAQE